MFDSANLNPPGAPRTMVVEFNGRRELRFVSHTEMRNGVEVEVPQTRDDEDVVWLEGRSFPRVVHK